MKTTKLLSLAITALVALASTAWASPHGGGGGGHFGGDSFVGSHVGGGHFGGARIGGFDVGGIRAAPTFSGGGARFSASRGIGGPNRAPQQFSYYTGVRTSASPPRASARQLPNRSIDSTAGRVAPVNRQANRVNPVGQKRATNPRPSTAENQQSFVKNHAFDRHDGSWHRDWDKRRAHFNRGHVFVFVGGSWW